MNLLIDAFNLIYKFPALLEKMQENNLSGARNGLMEILNQYSLKKGNLSIKAFFDGKKEKGDPSLQEKKDGIDIYYSHSYTADHLIKTFLRENPNPGNYYLISSDKDLGFAAKKYKCKVILSEEFADMVMNFLSKKDEIPEKESDIKLHSTEIDYWKSIFLSNKNVGT